MGIESDVDAAEIGEGAHQKSGADENHDRQRDLRHHQRMASAEPFSASVPRTAGASLAGLERRGQVDANAAKSRRDAEKNTSE